LYDVFYECVLFLSVCLSLCDLFLCICFMFYVYVYGPQLSEINK